MPDPHQVESDAAVIAAIGGFPLQETRDALFTAFADIEEEVELAIPPVLSVTCFIDIDMGTLSIGNAPCEAILDEYEQRLVREIDERLLALSTIRERHALCH